MNKVLFQTSKDKLDTRISDMIKKNLGNSWNYEFYNDEDIFRFFKENPIDDLPDIAIKFNSIIRGEHRADLFRYYYLYLRGGFFIDSDAMIYKNIEDIIGDYEFISVNSNIPQSIFQGILGATPKNEIIRKALYHAYNTDPIQLNSDYHYWCKELYKIVKQDTDYRKKLFRESRKPYGDDIVDDNTIVFRHYWRAKTIEEGWIL